MKHLADYGTIVLLILWIGIGFYKFGKLEQRVTDLKDIVYKLNSNLHGGEESGT